MQPETDPDVAWVAALAGSSRSSAEKYLGEAGSDAALFRHLAREHREGGRSGYVEIDAPQELYALTRLLRPRHVVEVGVSSGVSSAYLLRALEKNGRGTLHSVDLPKIDRRPPNRSASQTASWSLPFGRGPGWAVPNRLRKRWDLRWGDKAEVLPLLTEELPEVGLFVYDVPHWDRDSLREFRGLDPRLPSGAVAIADHGPSGDLCRALRQWARLRHAVPVRRTGLGLYGFRCGSRAARPKR
ncbi:MAG TPA: class I SAM-dependent methyltransferase [Thermoplasmata archaeon]|nr:class I SAM-dependent methyltransferase [Thermoplasmata archaeon]